jgi:hypothetical protein
MKPLPRVAPPPPSPGSAVSPITIRRALTSALGEVIELDHVNEVDRCEIPFDLGLPQWVDVDKLAVKGACHLLGRV